MLYYIKKYPLSLLILIAVVYLSFFNPPSIGESPFPHFDKFVHFCMYAGLSGILWLEHFWNHRKTRPNLKRGLIGAVLFPVLLGGLIEIGQAYLTTTRSGDIWDFFADILGVLIATLVCWYMIRPLFRKKNEKFKSKNI